jgi:hypothetical protein
MAAAAALKTAIVTLLEGLAVGARPAYGRHNRPYEQIRNEPDTGASSHRKLWFLPPKGREEQGMGPSLSLFDADMEFRVALNFNGLTLDEKHEALEAEAVFLTSQIKRLAHPAGIRWHRVQGWDWEPEDENLTDVTLVLTITFMAAEAV